MFIPSVSASHLFDQLASTRGLRNCGRYIFVLQATGRIEMNQFGLLGALHHGQIKGRL